MTKANSVPQHRTCIFCGFYGQLTREHLLSAWILRKFSLDGAPTNHTVTRVREEAIDYGPGEMHRPGGSAKRRHIVCSPCNNGWMSVLEKAAKPILEHLAKAHLAPLTEDERQKVASWIALKSMVLERADPTTAMISASQRKSLMDSGEIPRGWLVWVGRYAGKQTLPQWAHFSGYDRQAVGATGLSGDPGGYQLTIIQWDSLLIRALSHNTPERIKVTWPEWTGDSREYGLRLIWPSDDLSMKSLGGKINDLGMEMMIAETMRHDQPHLPNEELSEIVGNSGTMLLR